MKNYIIGITDLNIHNIFPDYPKIDIDIITNLGENDVDQFVLPALTGFKENKDRIRKRYISLLEKLIDKKDLVNILKKELNELSCVKLLKDSNNSEIVLEGGSWWEEFWDWLFGDDEYDFEDEEGYDPYKDEGGTCMYCNEDGCYFMPCDLDPGEWA